MSAAAAETANAAVSRTKEGIPTWGGEASSFVQYEEAALLWEQSLTWEKRYTAGPRLVQELSGAARRLVAGQPAGWVAYRGGVTQLMDHLRQALGKPRVNEVTDLLAAYFKGTKRRSSESMNEYITRKFEAYMRASQSMRRVAPHYESGPREPDWEPRTWSRRSSGEQSYWGGASGPATVAGSEEAGTTSGGVPSETTTAAATENVDTWTSASWQGWGASWGQWSGWYGGSNWSYPGRAWDWSSTSSSSSVMDQTSRSSELLPAFIQGWYLLADAGLDNNERNLVITAINGDFSPQRVAQELRNQFPEGEVKRRDQSRRFQSYVGDLHEESEGDMEVPGNSAQELLDEGLSEEGIALVVNAENQAQEAMAALFQAKRTLKEARQKQLQVKQNRRYYTSTGRPGGSTGSSSAPRDDSHLDCLRCGKRGHRAANCPIKPVAATVEEGSAGTEPQQAPFVCYAEAQSMACEKDDFVGFANTIESEEAFHTRHTDDGLTTQEAVQRGLAVIDGGATQTIGSVKALEAVLSRNLEKYGETRLRGVNFESPPTFSFGNSTENRCLSTARLGVQANGVSGELNVHALDHGQSPILLSVDTLRKLGAVIDFEADLAVFRRLNAHRVIRLARGRTGHQLIPLTEDWLSHGEQSAQAVPSLTSFLSS